jgi:hypothetical protein
MKEYIILLKIFQHLLSMPQRCDSKSERIRRLNTVLSVIKRF